MNILFFDCETNALPTNYKAHPSDVDCWPRCIQIGYQIANTETELVLREFSSLVQPHFWEVPKEKFWIEHGFSTEKCLEFGVSMPSILDQLINDIEVYDIQLIVSHNIAFDYPIIASEMVRYQKRAQRKVEKFCTMQATINLCKIPFASTTYSYRKHERFKFPKLIELYNFLFQKDFEGSHDAGNDATAVRLCFFELVKRGVFNISKPETINT